MTEHWSSDECSPMWAYWPPDRGKACLNPGRNYVDGPGDCGRLGAMTMELWPRPVVPQELVLGMPKPGTAAWLARLCGKDRTCGFC